MRQEKNENAQSYAPEYRAYIQSKEWFALRRLALEQAEHRCQLCDRAENLRVHHRTYERLGHERLTDLTVLCAVCHRSFHSWEKRRRIEGLDEKGGWRDEPMLEPMPDPEPPTVGYWQGVSTTPDRPAMSPPVLIEND
jgi:hypothetical protein